MIKKQKIIRAQCVFIKFTTSPTSPVNGQSRGEVPGETEKSL